MQHFNRPATFFAVEGDDVVALRELLVKGKADLRAKDSVSLEQWKLFHHVNRKYNHANHVRL